MGDAPQPLRRLSWPAVDPQGDADRLVADPGGNWLAGASSPTASADPTLDWLFRDPRRWAPQHGPTGRLPAATPPLPPSLHHRSTPPPAVAQPGATALLGHRTAILRETLETLLLALLVFLVVRASVQHYRVEGVSMEPTLENGEFLLVNTLAYTRVDLQALARYIPFWDPGPPADRYLLRGPARGDIVVFHHPSGVHRDLVKRIVGLPGETIEIRAGIVYIDGRPLIEPYLAGSEAPVGEMAPLRIPSGSYFVMGDNRNHSQDSRVIGPIPANLIVGRAMLTWWPYDRFGPAPNQAPRLAEATSPLPSTDPGAVRP